MDTIDRIIELMQEQKISGADLSRACDLGSSKFYQWKSRRQKPSAESLVKIASHLGTTVEYLTGQTDQKEKPATQMSDELNKKELELIQAFRIAPETTRKAIQLLLKGI